jgi:hypothetical protein
VKGCYDLDRRERPGLLPQLLEVEDPSSFARQSPLTKIELPGPFNQLGQRCRQGLAKIGLQGRNDCGTVGMHIRLECMRLSRAAAKQPCEPLEMLTYLSLFDFRTKLVHKGTHVHVPSVLADDGVEMTVLSQISGLLDVDHPEDDRSSHSKPSLFISRIRNGVMLDCIPSFRSLNCRPVRKYKRRK